MSSSTPTQVADRLDRLAEQAPARLGDPDALWSQGRRRQRTRWAGTAAALVVLAVLGAVAVPSALHRTQDLVAESPDSGLRLPDVIRQPGEWEGAFSGAPGRLVVVGVGSRGGWWSSSGALWGVSTTTGEARFLDLPDAVTSTDATPALSADGRRLAYWFKGETAREPLRIDDQDPAVGVAVMDLETGEVERWDAESDHGLTADGLAWAGDVLWWDGGVYEDGGTATSWGARHQVHTWDVGSGARRDVEKGARIWVDVTGPAPAGFLAPNGRDGLQLVAGSEPGAAVRPDPALVTQDHSAPAVSPDGSRIAGVHDPDAQDSGEQALVDDPRTPLLVGEVGDGTTEMVPVGDVESTAVLGWRSDDDVVISTYDGEGADVRYSASVVDLDTGDVTQLLDFSNHNGLQLAFAADAWGAELVDAPDAPWAPDPRFVGLVLLVLGTFVVSLVNSVRRRRGRA